MASKPGLDPETYSDSTVRGPIDRGHGPAPRTLAHEARFGLGRANELGTLAQELALVRGSRIRGVVLDGTPGIGKTTCWRRSRNR